MNSISVLARSLPAPARRRFPASIRTAAAALAVLAATGCALAPRTAGPATALSRGHELLEAGQYHQARDFFRVALSVRPGDQRAQLGLAAAFEATDELDSARAIYDELSTSRLPRGVRRQLEARLNLLARRAREHAARAAVANEDSLSRQPPVPGTIAVLPFEYVGRDSTVVPLQRGLAQLLVTDLGRISALTVLERERVQSILDEIALTQAGRVDSVSRVRSGRILRAAQLVQGSMFDLPGQPGLQVDASVVNTATSDVAAQSSASDRLEAIFALQKTILFQLVDRLGIPLTLGERQRLAERPTSNFLAFSAYSRGLVASDRGRFAEAAAEFATAARLDPGFRAAGEAAARAAGVSQARATSMVEVATLLSVVPLETAFMADNLNRVMPSGMELIDRAQIPREIAPPGQRGPLGDVGGGDRMIPPVGYGAIEIIVKRP